MATVIEKLTKSRMFWVVGVTVVAVVITSSCMFSARKKNWEKKQQRMFGSYEHATVSCDAPYCAEIAKSMLVKGGSVADAAIAGLLCMGVVHSQSMGIGGGFLMVIYNGKTKEAKVLNARETAPAFATENMFSGDSNKSQRGGLAVAIPGEIRGYWELWKKYGKLPWRTLFQPAIILARGGFNVTAHTASSIKYEWDVIKEVPSLREILVDKKSGLPFEEGSIMRRIKLAETLYLIAENNAVEFYEGKVAQWFVDDLYDFGGNITMEDMKNYKVEWTDPLKIEIHNNLTLYATPPTGSGLLIGFILKVLSGYRMHPGSIATENDTIITTQRIVEAFKHAFAYRTHLGDPSDESIAVTVHELIRNLTSDDFVSIIRKKIDENSEKTNNSFEFYGAKLYTPDDHGTAHISVVGPNGDAISVTSTINTYFGARIRSRKTGIIYNNEMDDFSAPGITNYFGVRPSPNNFIRPGKRPLSSMTPAIFVDQAGKVRLVIGCAGGTKIITATTLAAIRNLWFEESITDAIDNARFHHQLYPMELDFETGFPEYMQKSFEKFGHKVIRNPIPSAVNGISIQSNGTLNAKADIRKPGSVSGF